MKIDVTCALVRDLLPLYADGVLSGESSALVDAHLPECPPCTSELESLRAPVPVKAKSARKSLKGARRRLLIGLGTAVLAIVVVFSLFAIRVYPEIRPDMNTPVPYHDGLFEPPFAFVSPEDGLTYLNVRVARQPAFEYYGTGSTYSEDVVVIDGVRTGVGYVWLGKGEREREKSAKKAGKYGGRNPDVVSYGVSFHQLSPMTEQQKDEFRNWEEEALGGNPWKAIDESLYANWARDIPITRMYYYDGPMADLMGDTLAGGWSQPLGWSERNGVFEASVLLWDADATNPTQTPPPFFPRTTEPGEVTTAPFVQPAE